MVRDASDLAGRAHLRVRLPVHYHDLLVRGPLPDCGRAGTLPDGVGKLLVLIATFRRSLDLLDYGILRVINGLVTPGAAGCAGLLSRLLLLTCGAAFADGTGERRFI